MASQARRHWPGSDNPARWCGRHRPRGRSTRELARAPKCNCRTCRIRRMDSLSVGIPIPSIDCDGETWTRVNTDPRDDLFFPDALFLSGGGWPGSDWNGGRHQIGTVAAIRSEYLAALRWNSHYGPSTAIGSGTCCNRNRRSPPRTCNPANRATTIRRSDPPPRRRRPPACNPKRHDNANHHDAGLRTRDPGGPQTSSRPRHCKVRNRRHPPARPARRTLSYAARRRPPPITRASSPPLTVTTQHLRNGDKIRLTDLGILQVRARPARMGRNPVTGETMKIKASKKIAFRPAKELKESV